MNKPIIETAGYARPTAAKSPSRISPSAYLRVRCLAFWGQMAPARYIGQDAAGPCRAERRLSTGSRLSTRPYGDDGARRVSAGAFPLSRMAPGCRAAGLARAALRHGRCRAQATGTGAAGAGRAAGPCTAADRRVLEGDAPAHRPGPGTAERPRWCSSTSRPPPSIPFGRMLVRGIIRDLKARGTTVFLNSHLLGEVEATCDRVSFIKQGRVLRTVVLSKFSKPSPCGAARRRRHAGAACGAGRISCRSGACWTEPCRAAAG